MGNNVRKIVFPFHENASVIANGKELNVGLGMVSMNLAVTGDATGFNIIIEAKDNDNDDYTPISAVNLETFDISPNITATGKYQVSLEGHVKVRCRLSAISFGSITLKGTVID